MNAEGKQFGVQSNPLSNNEGAKAKATGMNLPQSSYSMPVERREFMLITSPYGQREDPINKGKTQIHHGIDIKTNKDNVLATETMAWLSVSIIELQLMAVKPLRWSMLVKTELKQECNTCILVKYPSRKAIRSMLVRSWAFRVIPAHEPQVSIFIWRH